MSVLTLIKNNKKTELAFSGNPVLRDLLEQTGYAVFSPCGGKGTCGKCKVLLQGAVSEPNGHEIAANCRLACQAVLLGDATAELVGLEENFAEIETETAKAVIASEKTWKYGAAVDIGTTTVVLKLFSNDGSCIGEAASLNPQRSISADVIGRIDAALHGKAELLQNQITECIDFLLQKACNTAMLSPDEVETKILTGNTAMLYLLTNRSPESISRAPFVSETLFGEWIEDTYLPHCMNAFVGADITCAVLASGMCESEETSLLCDIGTNGEIALWKNGKLYITSTAAGPAFEGAEISCGCGSIPGAIDRVWVENGEVKAHTINNVPACGICGSGLIDAVAAFLELGYIDETGSVASPLILSANGGQIEIEPVDISAVQLAKAAIAAGIEIVLSRSDTSVEEVKTLYLAGGFGNHLSMQSASRIGLVPSSLAECSVTIGNAALSGAVMMLFDSAQIAKSEQIAASSEHVNLGGSSDFNSAYIENMIFPED